MFLLSLSPLDLMSIGHLDNRISTVSAGLSMSLVVFMILTSQAGLYFWRKSIHSRDPLWIKSSVIFIWTMQALEVALACWTTIFTHSNNSVLSEKALKNIALTLAMYIGTCATTGCLVHAFFISRIHLLESKLVHIRVSVVLCIIVILEACSAIVSILPCFEIIAFSSVTWAMPTWFGLSILADILIAGSVCYILKKNSPFTSISLDLLVKRLTKFGIQTGLITGLVTGVSLAIWMAAQLDPGHFVMCLPMGGIYANCFMTNLIARESYLCHIQMDENDEWFRMATSPIVFSTP